MMLYCHRTSVLKPWFNCSTLTKFHFSCGVGVGVRCFSSPSQADLVDKETSNLPLPPPQSLSSPLMFVPPSPSPRVGVDESESSADHNDYFHFFSPAAQTKIRVKKKLSIPGQKEILTPDDAVCVGSSHGWLAFVNPRSCCPYLFNPLIQSCHLPYVPLPPYETFPHVRFLRAQKSNLLSPSPSLVKDLMFHFSNRFAVKESEHFIEKVALSSAPSLPRTSKSPQKYCNDDQDNCTVVIIDRDETYFCKLGDERWHILAEPDNGFYNEIMYFSKDQRFYTMRGPRHIEAWDLSDPSSPKRAKIKPSSCPMELETTQQFLSSNEFSSCLSYLVESSGDLLLVIRFCVEATPYEEDEDHYDRFKEQKASANFEDYMRPFYQSLRFDVYKLNFDQNKWEPVECLSDRALFVGRNHSFSLSIRDYPDLKENSIYFTDNYQPLFDRTGHDNGIFHLKDNSITPYYPPTSKMSSKLPQVAVPEPIWVAPNKL